LIFQGFFIEISCKGGQVMVDFQYKDFYNYGDLLHIMELLRSPGGCPWDREQDHVSLRRNFLEETCEAVEAIDREDKSALCEELGDVLLQVVFHAELEREAGGFTMDDVVDGICKKLVYRHPHVFGDAQAADTNEVLSRWETLKRKEKGQASTADAVDAVARTLPGLWRAEKMLQKASKAGFDWSSADGALNKLEEETAELRQAVLTGADDAHGVQEELGDVLFSAARIAQEQGIDPEAALHGACDKFSRRFRAVEELSGDISMADCSEEELVALWNRAKNQEKS
jgi:tetrapyrrole methylase family protein/MazG family protein